MPSRPKPKPTASSRRPRVRRGNAADAAQLRADLLDAAMALFAAGGLDAVSVRAVAAHVGVSPMTPYRYFSDKAELLYGLWARVLETLDADIEAALAVVTAPRERHAAHIDAYVGYWESHPDQYRLFYLTQSTPLRKDAEGRVQRGPAYERLLRSGLEVTEALASELNVASTHVQLACDVRLALQFGYLQAALANRRYPWSERSILRATCLKQIAAAVERVLVDGP